MYCRYCGKRIGEDDSYCRYCGKRVRMKENHKQLYFPFGPGELSDPNATRVTKDDISCGIEDDEGVLYSQDGKRLLSCENIKVNSYTIKDGTKIICADVFHYGNNVMKITIPDSVEYISELAFCSCRSLIKFVVSKENKYYRSVDGVLFSKDMSVLTHFPQDHTSSHYVIPNNVRSIGHHAFANCSALEKITISESVSYIGRAAFKYCKNLISAIVPDGVCVIDEEAFYGCEKLENINIPSTLWTISGSTFYLCHRIYRIELSKYVKDIGPSAFAHCYGLQHITIPDRLRSIGESAFHKCFNLKSITIPYKVEKIESDTFHKNYNLSEIYLKNPVPPKCDRLSFGWTGIDKDNCILHVPQGSKDAYTKAEGWKDFKNIREIDMNEEAKL